MFLVRPASIFILAVFILNNCGVKGGGYGDPSGGSSSSFASSSADSNGNQHAITSTHQSGTGVGTAGAGASVFGDGQSGTTGGSNGYGGGGLASGGGASGSIGGHSSPTGSESSYSPSSGPAIGKPPGTYGSFDLSPNRNVGSVPSVQGNVESNRGPTGSVSSTNSGGGGLGSFSSSLPGNSFTADGTPISGGSVYTSSGNIPSYGFGGAGNYGSGYASSFGGSGAGGLAYSGNGGAQNAASEFQNIIEQFMKNLQSLHESQINQHFNNPGFQGLNDIVHGSGGPNPDGYAGGYGGSTSFSSAGSGGFGGNTFGGAWAGPVGAGTFNSQPGSYGGVQPGGFTGHGGVQPGGYSGNRGVQPNGFSGQFGGGNDPTSGSAFSSASLGPQGGHGSAHIYPSQEGLDLRFARPIGPNVGGSKSVFSSSSSGSSTVDGKTTSYKKATFTVNDNGNVTTYTISDP